VVASETKTKRSGTLPVNCLFRRTPAWILVHRTDRLTAEWNSCTRLRGHEPASNRSRVRRVAAGRRFPSPAAHAAGATKRGARRCSASAPQTKARPRGPQPAHMATWTRAHPARPCRRSGSRIWTGEMLLFSFFFFPTRAPYLSFRNRRKDGGTRLTGDASHPCLPGVREPAGSEGLARPEEKKTPAVLFD